MQGDPLTERIYNHLAFKMDEADYDDRLARIRSLGLEVKEGRSRVEGEGHSIYFTTKTTTFSSCTVAHSQPV